MFSFSDQETKMNTLTREDTMEDPEVTGTSAGYSLYPIHDSLRLLDAHLIFEPLLSSLGVVPQQMVNSGGNLTPRECLRLLPLVFHLSSPRQAERQWSEAHGT